MPKDLSKRDIQRGITRMLCYVCTECSTPHKCSSDAADCCRCNTCRQKFPRDGFGSICGHCSYGIQIRETRKDVRRHADALKSSEERLSDLLKRKRPPKGSQVI